MRVRGTAMGNGSHTVNPITVRAAVSTRDELVMDKAKDQWKERHSQGHNVSESSKDSPGSARGGSCSHSVSGQSHFLNPHSDTDLPCSLRIYNGATLFYEGFSISKMFSMSKMKTRSPAALPTLHSLPWLTLQPSSAIITPDFPPSLSPQTETHVTLSPTTAKCTDELASYWEVLWSLKLTQFGERDSLREGI